MIKLSSKGSFKKSYRFLEFLLRGEYLRRLNEYGQQGVDALMAATPKNTGKTAASWGYKIDEKFNSVSITWTNTNLTNTGVPVAVLIQYGHGTKSGKYVKGIDYINPALQPVFDKIAESIWEEVEEN